MKNKILKLAFLFFFTTVYNLYSQLEAHLIENEGWAKGKYVEIGINKKGVFGSNTRNKPDTFHNNREKENFLFGFIANPQKDNWVDYDGDFFTPGAPEEGFTVEINGKNYSNNNEFGINQISGGVISSEKIESDCFESIAQISWAGEVDKLRIKRFYSVTENGLFIQMITTITNTDDVVKKNVYFMHNVDPDNNVTLSDNYETNLKIISQSTVGNNISLVTSNQPAVGGIKDQDGSNVSLYSDDPRAKVSFGGFSNRNASDIWNGISVTNTVGASLYDDYAMSIAFNIGDISPKETKTFVYYYILKEIDKTFTPLIINIIPSNPTECNKSDGSLLFSGLEANESYNISYTENGILIPEATYTADNIGNIEFTNLREASYSDFKISFNGCVTSLKTTHTLSPPIKPLNPVFSSIPPSNCDGNNGEIIISGLVPGEETLVNYKIDGINIPTAKYTPNDEGKISIGDLKNAVISDFYLAYTSNSCPKTPSDRIVLNGTFPYTTTKIPDQFFCDEDFDYKTNIQLKLFDQITLGTLPKTDYSVTYHSSSDNAINNIPLDKDNYITTGIQSYDIFAKITNNDSKCYKLERFKITVNIPADFNIRDDFLCKVTDTNFYVPEINTYLDNKKHIFEWSLNNRPLGINSPNLKINQAGDYKVKVTTISSGCSIIKEARIIPSGEPDKVELILNSELFANNHVVTVKTSGRGNYLYRLNDGAYQKSNIFENVPAGQNIFYVLDENGCGEVNNSITIIDYPRFFTPNEDGHNDLWQIIGIDELKNPRIQIFDRFGKPLSILTKQDKGWNGIYNGRKLPKNDYWFVLFFTDKDGATQQFKAHFSLLY
ncbi:T9SS type B sorting domain-containing protein [Tenacibaculum sp. 190524A02b]|uniref:T9SS type B sorting domain-containing protein n=2 Tax=Tenacibaculum vairaonense TaxID=3137860 RepID=UPI0031FAC272